MPGAAPRNSSRMASNEATSDRPVDQQGQRSLTMKFVDFGISRESLLMASNVSEYSREREAWASSFAGVSPVSAAEPVMIECRRAAL